MFVGWQFKKLWYIADEPETTLKLAKDTQPDVKGLTNQVRVLKQLTDYSASVKRLALEPLDMWYGHVVAMDELIVAIREGTAVA